MKRKLILKVIDVIEEETKHYIEEDIYSYKFQAKVLAILKEVVRNNELELIAEKAFTGDIIDSYVDEFESD